MFVLRKYSAVFVSIFLLGAGPTSAQRLTLPYISDSALQQAGLDYAWQTHITLDTSRSKLSYLTIDLNGTNTKTVYDVISSDGKVLKSMLAGSRDPKGRIVDSEGARHLADVEVRWLKELGTTAEVKERMVPDFLLLVQTNNGTVQAIDAESGATRWTVTPGNRQYPNQKPAANDQYAAIINGSSLFLYDQQTQRMLGRKQLSGAPGAGAVFTSDRVFVPLLNGMVETFRFDDSSRSDGRVASYGRAMSVPTLTPRSLSWASDRGILHGIDPATKQELFRYDTGAKIVAPSVSLPPERLLIASNDGYVHCIDEVRGKVMWRFSCGEAVNQAPMVFDSGVYVATKAAQLIRIAPENGAEVWTSEGVTEILGSDGKQIFGRGGAGELVVIEVEHGTHTTTVPMQNIDLTLQNPLTDRIYVANSAGRVMCLRNQSQTWPLLHRIGQQELDAAQELLKRKSAATAAPAERPAPADSGSGSEDAEEPAAEENADEAFPAGDDEANPLGDEENPLEDAAVDEAEMPGDAAEDPAGAEEPLPAEEGDIDIFGDQ